MAGGMNLDSFDQAIDLGNDLKEIVNQITESKNQMMSKVNALCDIWQSAASQHYMRNLQKWQIRLTHWEKWQHSSRKM